jgi:hypothetical protein
VIKGIDALLMELEREEPQAVTGKVTTGGTGLQRKKGGRVFLLLGVRVIVGLSLKQL